MVGYAPNGYRLWDKIERKITIHRDVLFNEDKNNNGHLDGKNQESTDERRKVIISEDIDIPEEINENVETIVEDNENRDENNSSTDYETVECEENTDYQTPTTSTKRLQPRRTTRNVKPIRFTDYDLEESAYLTYQDVVN